MINFYEVSIILFAHYIADFLFQTNWMAKGKSSSLMKLSVHILTYTLVLFVCCFFLILIRYDITISDLMVYAIVSGMLHFSVDFFTSKITSWQHTNGYMGSDSVPNLGFFSTIGADQLIHSLCLIGLYIFMFSK